MYQAPGPRGRGRYGMIIGSGTRRTGSQPQRRGCVMRYTAPALVGPWRYEGVLHEALAGQGRVCECPALLWVCGCILQGCF